ncbi:MAG TPA: M23 family metallopeptidase [Burkholderiales bacterium]|nr:M23 family metallopeptidase [Burkholderiales bacterium]
MDIILVSGDSAKARTITVRLSHALILWLATIVLVTATSLGLSRGFSGARSSATLAMPVDVQPAAVLAIEERMTAESQPATDLHIMARHIAQLQAQLLRLDMLADRLARLAGFPAQELMFGTEPTGGPQTVSARAALTPSLDELTNQFDEIVARLRERSESWGALESLFSLDNLRRKLLPTMSPATSMGYSANYGWRIDPFTHERAFHEGIDIMAEEGTPIVAAAGGVVVYSDFHPQYGNMIEIDHGNSLVSRYAHASKRIVHVGDVVAKGAKIGEIGSTGRATGAHLHFEVRQDGAPRNPAAFLRLRG